MKTIMLIISFAFIAFVEAQYFSYVSDAAQQSQQGKLSAFIDQILKSFNQPNESPTARSNSPHVNLKLTKYEISIPESSILETPPPQTFQPPASKPVAPPIVGSFGVGGDKNDQGIDPKCLASLCG